ncbi:MAG: glycosyltransferase [Anaerolineae bacterium]
MPVYDAEPFLREAIESILRQTFIGFEFVIIDDCSTDSSAEIVKSFSDPRIHYFRNAQNIGLTRSLNRGLVLSQSPYVARMDADDVSMPQRLSRQIDFLDSNPEVGVVGSAVQIIDEEGNLCRVKRLPKSHEVLTWCLCLFSPIAHPTVMMRRNALEQVGGYRADLLTAQDYDLWWRISKVTRLANLPDVLLYLREQKASVRHRHLDEHRKARAEIAQRVISEFLQKDISLDVIMHIIEQSCNSGSQVREAASVVYELYKIGVAQGALTLAEKRLVRGYVAKRLMRLAYRRTDDGRAWDVIKSACLLDPLVVVKLAHKRFRSAVRC